MHTTLNLAAAIFWIFLGHSAMSESTINPPSRVKCDEYMQLTKTVLETHAVYNKDAFTLNTYLNWGIGYIQGRSPSFFPAFMKYSVETVKFAGKTVPSLEEYPFYLGYVITAYNLKCKDDSNRTLEEVLEISIAELPKILNLNLKFDIK